MRVPMQNPIRVLQSGRGRNMREIKSFMGTTQPDLLYNDILLMYRINMRHFLLILCFAAAFLLPLRAEPWPDREKLVYQVRWGLIEAAEGIFTAKSQDNTWKFSLLLKSSGTVD